MTVVNHVARDQYSATNGQTIFNYTFEIADSGSIQVFQRASTADPDDTLDLLVYGVDYTLTAVGNENGGTVVLTTGATTGDIITIQGNAPAERDTSFTPGGVIQAANLNTEFDNDVLIYQTILAKLDELTPKYAKSAYVEAVDLVLPVLGENQFWLMNGTRTEIVAQDFSSVIGGGTVTQVNTGLGLTGGPITNAGTISFAAMAANTFWGNITGGSAVPTEVTTAYFAQTANNLSDLTDFAQARTNLGLAIGTNVQAYSAALTSIAGLTTVANDLIYTTASNTYAVLSPVANRALVSGLGGAFSWSDTLPQAVQTNIQYLGVQNQNFDMGGFQINNGADPTQPSDFATKSYVDLNALNGTSVYVATDANLDVTQAGSGVGATLTDASGTFAVFTTDGVSPPVGSLVLVKNLSIAASHQGIYSLTTNGDTVTVPYVLTRATNYDTPTEINQTGLIVVQNGSTLAGTAWYNAATIVTVDTTNFSYSQFGNIVFPVSLANGGTNANLVASAGAVVYSTPTALALSTVGSSGQLFQSAGAAAPGWTTSTYPSSAGATANKVLLSDGTNFVLSTPTFPNASATSGKIIISDGTNWIASTSLWPDTVGTAGKIIRSDGTTNTYSTATFADTYTASNLLYSNGSNTVTGLATGNNGVLVTSAGGVPSISSTLPSGLTIPGYAASGANADITSLTGLTGTLQAPTGVKSSAGVDLLAFTYTASAVNYLTITNNTTGNKPSIAATGTDTNITLQLKGKGTGGAAVLGTSTNDNATAGYVGEFMEASNLIGSPIVFTTSIAKTLQSITLTPGDWDVWGNIFWTGTTVTAGRVGLSTTADTQPDSSLTTFTNPLATSIAYGNSAPQRRFTVPTATTTTVYLVGTVSGTGTLNGAGGIYARRRS